MTVVKVVVTKLTRLFITHEPIQILLSIPFLQHSYTLPSFKTNGLIPLKASYLLFSKTLLTTVY